MGIFINLKEFNNVLQFLDEPQKIVCGNSNYEIDFEFSENWSLLTSKTLVISMNSKTQFIEFSGNTCALPSLPNGTSLLLYVIGSTTDGKNFATSSISIELVPTNVGISKETLETAENYLAVLSAKLETLKNNLEFFDKTTISNPNLLINGDFRINQRGKTTYTEANKYTVDRWKLLSGSLEVVGDGVILSGTIIQKLEHIPTGDVVCSVDTTGGDVSASYSNGAFTISTTTPTQIKWAKLEVGELATIFIPKLYNQELIDCMRYYRISKNISNDSSNFLNIATIVPASTTAGFTFFDFDIPFRVTPSLKFNANEIQIGYNNTSLAQTTISNIAYANRDVYFRKFKYYTTGTGFTASQPSYLCLNAGATFEFDAEIY